MRQIEELHKSNLKIYLVATGAGAGCQSILTEVPGASNTVIGCEFPYHKSQLRYIIGDEGLEHCCSKEVAKELSLVAFSRIRETYGYDGRAVGVGITGAIATNRILKGKHRVHACLYDGKQYFYVYLEFKKKDDGSSYNGRKWESEKCDLLGINLILWYTGLSQIGDNRYSDIFGSFFSIDSNISRYNINFFEYYKLEPESIEE